MVSGPNVLREERLRAAVPVPSVLAPTSPCRPDRKFWAKRSRGSSWMRASAAELRAVRVLHCAQGDGAKMTEGL